MKKLILIFALLLSSFLGQAQNATLDLAVLAGGVGYQKFATNPKMDNVLHFWGGYFATNALQVIINKSDLPKWAKKNYTDIFNDLLTHSKRELRRPI